MIFKHLCGAPGLGESSLIRESTDCTVVSAACCRDVPDVTDIGGTAGFLVSGHPTAGLAVAAASLSTVDYIRNVLCPQKSPFTRRKFIIIKNKKNGRKPKENTELCTKAKKEIEFL